MADEWIRTYNDFYGSPRFDAERNSAIAPLPRIEMDSYDSYARHRKMLELQQQMQPEIVLIGDSITHYWAGAPVAKRQSGLKVWQDTFGNGKILNMVFAGTTRKRFVATRP